MITPKDSSISTQEHIETINADIEKTLAEINQLVGTPRVVRNAKELAALEREMSQLTNRLSSLLLAQKLQQSLDSVELKEDASSCVKSQPKRYKNQGRREVTIRTVHGETIVVKTSYFSRAGVKRKKNRRGFYPGLIVLGIHDHCTPECASEISKLAVILSSYEEARHVLADRGMDIGVNTIRMISQRYAQRARVAQRRTISGCRMSVAGCRVVISTDGGRLRIRKNKPGAKTKKGRTRYSTTWREPKLLIISVVNLRGELVRRVTPFIDGTLKGPDAVFGLLRYYLGTLNIHLAAKVVFVADGARWMWNRVQTLLVSLGLKPTQFFELIDFYHAAQHVGNVATLRKGWNASQRKRWFKTYRKLLLGGKVDAVIQAIREVCRGRNSKKLRRERDYFERNRQRMAYKKVSEIGLPIGSGAMESAIRRVINLRLKGASMYWHRDTAEAMILLRSYYKAGRWDTLKKLAFSVPTIETA